MPGSTLDVAPAPPRPRQASARWVPPVLLLALACAATAWLAGSTRDPVPRQVLTDAALGRLAELGGPAGWTPWADVTSSTIVDGRIEQRDGMPVIMSHADDVEQSFEVAWTTEASPTSDGSCRAFAQWAVQLVPEPSAAEFLNQCRGALRSPLPGPIGEMAIFASGGTPPGPRGHTVVLGLSTADGVGRVRLFASVAFDSSVTLDPPAR